MPNFYGKLLDCLTVFLATITVVSALFAIFYARA